MKPCGYCKDRPSYSVDEDHLDGRCDTFYCCSKYIDWELDTKYRVEHERHADPQEERGLDYMIDDREV